MGVTLDQLGESMTAREFAQHYALERLEGAQPGQRDALGSILAALANGPLKPPDGRIWAVHDFAPDLWAVLRDDDTPKHPTVAQAPGTVQDILARARLAGMVH